MTDFEEGSVVIVQATLQIGTIVQLDQGAWVLLANGDIWVGSERGLRFPQDQADIDACVLNVDKFEGR